MTAALCLVAAVATVACAGGKATNEMLEVIPAQRFELVGADGNPLLQLFAKDGKVLWSALQTASIIARNQGQKVAGPRSCVQRGTVPEGEKVRLHVCVREAGDTEVCYRRASSCERSR